MTFEAYGAIPGSAHATARGLEQQFRPTDRSDGNGTSSRRLQGILDVIFDDAYWSKVAADAGGHTAGQTYTTHPQESSEPADSGEFPMPDFMARQWGHDEQPPA